MKKFLTVLLAIITFLFAVACADAGGNKSVDGDISADNLTKLQSLKGKVVYNIGEGNVPDLTFRSILKANGITYERGTAAKDGVVVLDYVNSGQGAISELLRDGTAYAIIPEPAATTALSRVAGSETFLDIQQAYGGQYPQAALVAKKAFVDANPNYVAEFMSLLSDCGEWLAENLDVGKAALTEMGSTTLGAITESSVRGSNIKFESIATQKSKIETYFNAIRTVGENDNNPIGGDNPPESFYASVTKNGDAENVTAKVYAPDGAPAMALAKLKATGGISAEYNVVSATEIGAKVTQNADIAVMPSNAAATLYNKGVDIVMLGIVTRGNLYMLRG